MESIIKFMLFLDKDVNFIEKFREHDTANVRCVKLNVFIKVISALTKELNKKEILNMSKSCEVQKNKQLNKSSLYFYDYYRFNKIVQDLLLQKENITAVFEKIYEINVNDENLIENLKTEVLSYDEDFLIYFEDFENIHLDFRIIFEEEDLLSIKSLYTYNNKINFDSYIKNYWSIKNKFKLAPNNSKLIKSETKTSLTNLAYFNMREQKVSFDFWKNLKNYLENTDNFPNQDNYMDYFKKNKMDKFHFITSYYFTGMIYKLISYTDKDVVDILILYFSDDNKLVSVDKLINIYIEYFYSNHSNDNLIFYYNKFRDYNLEKFFFKKIENSIHLNNLHGILIKNGLNNYSYKINKREFCDSIVQIKIDLDINEIKYCDSIFFLKDNSYYIKFFLDFLKSKEINQIRIKELNDLMYEIKIFIDKNAINLSYLLKEEDNQRRGYLENNFFFGILLKNNLILNEDEITLIKQFYNHNEKYINFIKFLEELNDSNDDELNLNHNMKNIIIIISVFTIENGFILLNFLSKFYKENGILDNEQIYHNLLKINLNEDLIDSFIDHLNYNLQDYNVYQLDKLFRKVQLDFINDIFLEIIKILNRDNLDNFIKDIKKDYIWLYFPDFIAKFERCGLKTIWILNFLSLWGFKRSNEKILYYDFLKQIKESFSIIFEDNLDLVEKEYLFDYKEDDNIEDLNEKDNYQNNWFIEDIKSKFKIYNIDFCGFFNYPQIKYIQKNDFIKKLNSIYYFIKNNFDLKRFIVNNSFIDLKLLSTNFNINDNFENLKPINIKDIRKISVNKNKNLDLVNNISNYMKYYDIIKKINQTSIDNNFNIDIYFKNFNKELNTNDIVNFINKYNIKIDRKLLGEFLNNFLSGGFINKKKFFFILNIYSHKVEDFKELYNYLLSKFDFEVNKICNYFSKLYNNYQINSKIELIEFLKTYYNLILKITDNCFDIDKYFKFIFYIIENNTLINYYMFLNRLKSLNKLSKNNWDIVFEQLKINIKSHINELRGAIKKIDYKKSGLIEIQRFLLALEIEDIYVTLEEFLSILNKLEIEVDEDKKFNYLNFLKKILGDFKLNLEISSIYELRYDINKKFQNDFNIFQSFWVKDLNLLTIKDNISIESLFKSFTK